MRIAVPTNDGVSISEHFGRSQGFLVFEVENGQIRAREVRPNTAQHSHQQGSCAGGSGGHEPHSHAGILTSLAQCDVVICAGMGSRAADALRAGGIATVIASASGPAEAIVGAYLKGELPTAEQGSCRCSH